MFIPHVALDPAITDSDDSGSAGQGKRRQTQRGKQVEGGPPEPTRRAGDEYPVVTECLRREYARTRAYQSSHVTGQQFMAGSLRSPGREYRVARPAGATIGAPAHFMPMAGQNQGATK